MSTSRTTLDLIRSILLGALVIALVGTGTELLLLGHTGTSIQFLPLLLLAAGLLILGWYGVRRSSASIRMLQLTMLLYLIAGVVGIYLHFQRNVELEIEVNPGIGGMELFRESITGAIPALAPGTMIHIGLLGLAYTFRHPALGPATGIPRSTRHP